MPSPFILSPMQRLIGSLTIFLALVTSSLAYEHVILTGGTALRKWENYRVEGDRHDKWWANFIRASTLQMDILKAQEGRPPRSLGSFTKNPTSSAAEKTANPTQHGSPSRLKNVELNLFGSTLVMTSSRSSTAYQLLAPAASTISDIPINIAFYSIIHRKFLVSRQLGSTSPTSKNLAHGPSLKRPFVRVGVAIVVKA